MVVLSSGHCEILVKDGFSKTDVKRFLFEHARVPLSEFPPEITPDRPGRPLLLIDGMVLPCRSADDIIIVIAGGPNPYQIVAMPTFGDTKAITKTIVTSS